MNSQSMRVISTDDVRRYVQRVYAWMISGLLLTGATSLAINTVPGLLEAMWSSGLSYVFMFAPFVIVMFIVVRVRTMSVSALAASFIAYAIVTGAWLAFIVARFTSESVAAAFLTTAGMFSATALYGYLTKRDLTALGSFMMMGLFGMIIAGVVSWFLPGSLLFNFAYNAIGVVVFVGLTAYDMQKLREEAEATADQGTTKATLMSALNLYLNFLNMFLFILRLVGRGRD